MKLFVLIGILLMLQSCYGINKKTSEIHNLDTSCLSDSAWTNIMKKYTTDSITDLKWIEMLSEFEEMPFPTEVLYFKDYPRELIGIATNYYSVRYVYNPKLSDQVLNGLSPQLNATEKKRIGKRILKLVMEYQCEEGRKRSQKMFEKE